MANNNDCSSATYNVAGLATATVDTTAVIANDWYNKIDPDAGKIFWLEGTNASYPYNYFLKQDSGYTHYGTVPDNKSWYDKIAWNNPWTGPANVNTTGSTNSWMPYCHNPNNCVVEHAMPSCATTGFWWNYGTFAGVTTVGRMWVRGERQRKAWNNLALGAPGRPESPATSCLALKTANAATPDGAYWIRPAGQQDAYELYCDMTRNGGGWTLIAKDDVGGNGDCIATGYQQRELDHPDVEGTAVLPVSWYNAIDPDGAKTFWIEATSSTKDYFFRNDAGYSHYGSVTNNTSWYDKTTWANAWTGPANMTGSGTTTSWAPYCHNPNGCLPEHAMSSCAQAGWWFNYGPWTGTWEKGRMWAR
jgi:hypothetical protein